MKIYVLIIMSCKAVNKAVFGEKDQHGEGAELGHLFEFTLKPIEECVLQGNDTKNIWWFWITDSWYTINLGGTRLFESSPAWREKYPGNPDMDYYYIRWLEDFFDILPDIAVDIPKDMYRLIDDEEKREQTRNQMIEFWEQHEDEDENVAEEIEDIYNEAMKLIYHGNLDTGFCAIAVCVVSAVRVTNW